MNSIRLVYYFSYIFYIAATSNVGINDTVSRVTCNSNNKIQYGRSSTTQEGCLKYGGCWESGFGCYFSQENIPGFRLIIGKCQLCSVYQSFTNLDIIDCSRECFKRSFCHCFLYNIESKVCGIIKDFCYPTKDTTGTQFVYNKYASKNMICSYGDCQGPVSIENVSNLEKCYEKCTNSSNCKMLTSIIQVDSPDFHACLLKKYTCDITLPENRWLTTSICIEGPAFSDWMVNHFTNRENIIDNLNDTCKNVSLINTFNLKIPWPSIGNSNPDFQILILGKKLRKCLKPKKDLEENGILTYVVDSFQQVANYLGTYKGCQLIDGDNDSFCKYACSCNKDYCQAVHIRAFNSIGSNMAVCNYQILT